MNSRGGERRGRERGLHSKLFCICAAFFLLRTVSKDPPPRIHISQREVFFLESLALLLVRSMLLFFSLSRQATFFYTLPPSGRPVCPRLGPMPSLQSPPPSPSRKASVRLKFLGPPAGRTHWGFFPFGGKCDEKKPANFQTGRVGELNFKRIIRAIAAGALRSPSYPCCWWAWSGGRSS